MVYNGTMKELIGHTIKSYKLDEGGTQLTFTTESGDIVYQAYGDCCSSSWFSDVYNFDALFNEKVNEVIERQEWTKEETEKAEAWGQYDSLSLYGYLIKTDNGTCDIEFRNDSNGYYGGSCELVKDETKEEHAGN